MDSLISAAARALAAGDSLGALKRIALRDDPPALALRGIAMAQLGEYPRARELLKRAARAFGSHEELSRARCVVAEAEVALAMRDLGGSPRALVSAATTLEKHADFGNATQARLIAVRRLLLIGHLDEAEAMLTKVDMKGLSPALETLAQMLTAELALRSLTIGPARDALALAQAAAARSGVPALLAEVGEARRSLDRPAARSVSHGVKKVLRLEEVEALLSSGALVVDACRRGLRADKVWIGLARRPVLFALARSLAEAWPGDVGRENLIADAFSTRRPNETHRARLRVEIGRLRTLLATLGRIQATERGFVFKPSGGREVVLLAPPIDGEQASLVALLADGESWSTSSLALALGASQRTVQRALVELETEGRARSIGKARTQRWLSPSLAGFTTTLLLPVAVPFA